MDFISNFDFDRLHLPDFKEDSVREELVLPLLNQLGYFGNDEANHLVRSRTLTHPFVKTGANTRRKIKSFPDYLLEVDSKPVWVLDAKSPKESIMSSSHREQVYFYAIHPDVRVSYYALCNGREFILFHISQDEAVLYFNLVDIEQYWEEMTQLLAPDAFRITTPFVQKRPTNRPQLDYLSVKPLKEITVLQKQSAKRHYGVHGYFTKQVWNVVRDYILNFTQVGDTVLDPFGGSGVTAIEALMNGRKGIHIDINPLSKFLVDTLLQPVNDVTLAEAYRTVCDTFDANKPETKKAIKTALKTYPYPSGVPLPKNSDVDTIEELFSEKQLAQLAYLKHLIQQVEDEPSRNTLMLMFSGLLNQINLTYHASGTRSPGRGDSAMFRYYRHRIAPNPSMLEVLPRFKLRYDRVMNAKREIAPILTANKLKNGQVIHGSATDLSFIPTDSVDYIYTDPPYGAKIPYLDLSIMWNAWLDLPISDEDFALEVIEGGEQGKSMEDYVDLLSQSIEEMFRVLKYDRWMSFVFAHKDPKFWYEIVYTAEKVGFEYVGAVQQSNGKTSYKKRQNPFRVIEGQLIINFKKVRNPKAIMRVEAGANVATLIEETVETTIMENGGAKIEEINNALIMRGLEMGFLDVLSQEYQDVSPFLEANYRYDDATERFHIRPDRRVKALIPPEVRIRYYLQALLQQFENNGEYPTSDELVWRVMPSLKNGKTPEKQTILTVLEQIAIPHEGGWRLVKRMNDDKQFGLGI